MLVTPVLSGWSKTKTLYLSHFFRNSVIFHGKKPYRIFLTSCTIWATANASGAREELNGLFMWVENNILDGR